MKGKQEIVHPLNLAFFQERNVKGVVYSDDDIVILSNVDVFVGEGALRTQENFVLVCLEGELLLDINGQHVHLNPRDLYFSRSNVIIDNYSISQNYRCLVFCMTDRILHVMLRSKINVWMEAAYMGESNVFHLSSNNIAMLEAYVSLVKTKLRLKENTLFHRDTMQSLLQALLLEFCDILCHLNNINRSSLPQGQILFNKFLALLSGIETKRHTVAYYASQLTVTPKYLNMVCKKYGNRPALKWIEHYEEEDIRYYLKNTTLSIKEVANLLHFPTLSFFGAYVKKHFGMTPKQLREEGNLKLKGDKNTERQSSKASSAGLSR
jgi:AraC-like DNA-binding protein